MLNQAVNTSLTETPTEIHLHELMTAAGEDKGVSFSCSFSKGNETYSLSLVYLEQLGGTFEWRMFAGKTQLWFHLTSDLMLVLNMIKDVLGESSSEQNTVEEQGKTFARLPILPKLKKVQETSPENDFRRHPYAILGPEEIPLTATFDTVPIYIAERHTQRQEHLTGSLDLVHITNLLQSVSLGQMTGRLRIQRPVASVDIYFEDGRPVHAAGTHSTGDECVLQVICWKDGQFHFEPRITTKEKTITQGINSLILQGVQLSDNTEFLKRAGVSMQAVLTRVHQKLSEAEFELMMLKGEPVDMGLLKAFYLKVHPGRPLQEVVSQLNLQRSQWVQIAANLIRCDAIRLERVSKREQLTIKPKILNSSYLSNVYSMLRDHETGLLTYSALLFLLDQQFEGAQKSTFSLLLFDVEPIRTGKAAVPRSTQFIKELACRIREGSPGYLTHYERHELALLVPGVEESAAAKSADEIKVSLLSATGLSGIEASNLSIGIGVANYPQDVNNMESLLAAVEMARSEAKRQGCAVILARHLSL
jgi:GGDEF domain-containing protein